MATLKVTVHEARDLPIMDRATGLADPYVVVKLDDMEHTTDIARRTRNPVWEHDVRFDTADLLVLQEDPLEIRVYDHDIISRDDIVGMVLLDCNSIIYRDNPTVSGWFPLIDSDAGLHGDIRLTIRIKFHAAENPLAPALPERYVRRLDPRVADQLLHIPPNVSAPPQQAQAQAPPTINSNSGTDGIHNLPTTPVFVSNSSTAEFTSTNPPPQQQQQRTPSVTVDQGAPLLFGQRGTVGVASSNGPYSKKHKAVQSQQQQHHSAQQPMSSLNPGTSPTGFANGGINATIANNVNPGIMSNATSMAVNHNDSASAVQLHSPVLLPFLVEQDLDPLQAARVDHPTLAAEEEGVFVFSVWRLDPAVFRVESTHSMMEELIVKSDPEHVRFTNLRSSRSINDARVIQLFKLSGKVRRQLARKVVELQCNAVLGYVEEFDMEPNGIIVRAYGTPCVISRVKYVDEREMQSFLRRKTQYLNSNVATLYQNELAQQLQMNPMSLPDGASPLMSSSGNNNNSNGNSNNNNSDGVGVNLACGPTYFPPPSTINPRVSFASSTSPMPTVTAAQDLQGASSNTAFSQPPLAPPLNYTSGSSKNNKSNEGNTAMLVGGSREYLLPLPLVPSTNNSVMATQMPPETTSTAVQFPATTPMHPPADPADRAEFEHLDDDNTAGGGTGAAGTSTSSFTLDDSGGRGGVLAELLVDSATAQGHPHFHSLPTIGGPATASATSSPSTHRSSGGTSLDGAIVKAPADTAAAVTAPASSHTFVAVVVSSSSTGTPTYAGNASDVTALTVSQNLQNAQQQQQLANLQLSANRAGPPETNVAALLPSTTAAAVSGPSNVPTVVAGSASQLGPVPPTTTTVVAAGGSPALTAPARVIISMLTVKDLPAGSIHHIGGYICARSVKIVSRVKSRQMISQERDAWWMELREELRANARAFHCNTVLGYEEETQYHEDVVLLSLYGTAVMLDVSVTSLRAGPEYLFRQQRQRTAAKRNCTLLHLYEGPRRKSGQQGLGLLAGEVGDLLLHHVCSICHNKPVPEVLLAACALPAELSCEAPPRLVQVAVSKTKPNVKGVDLAMAVSQALPFIEFALHKQLIFNLRLQQMNACFSLRVSIVVGPDVIVGMLTGSGCRLAGLPVPKPPRMSLVDPLIANKESVVKLRDVIASRHRPHCNDTHSSSSSQSSSSSSSSSSSTSSTRSSAFSASATGKPLTTLQPALTKGSERSSSVVCMSSTDDTRATAAASYSQQQPNATALHAVMSNLAHSPTSTSTSKRRQKRHSHHKQPQQQKSKRSGRNHRSRRRTHGSKHRDNKSSDRSSVSSASASADPQPDAPSDSTSSASDPLRSEIQGCEAKSHCVKCHHRKHHCTRSTVHNNSNSTSASAVAHDMVGSSHKTSAAATRSAFSATSSTGSTSNISLSSVSSRSRSSSTSSSRSSSSSSSGSSNSWVPTESSESDEDVYAPADEWQASSSGVRTKTSDYVVKIDDVEEADMMLGMVDSTNFEDGVLLTLPYVPDSANAFDWQERIVLDRRYSRAPAPLFVGAGGGSGVGSANNSSTNGISCVYVGNTTKRGGVSNTTFTDAAYRGEDGEQGNLSGGGGDGSRAARGSNTTASAVASAAAGRTALTTRLLNEYCADAKRAFVHRACRMAMRTTQPLRLRVVNVRIEMMFVPNSADLQLRLEGCVMVASSAGLRQLRALEDRAFRVCMHHTIESLSGLWQYHQRQSQRSHNNGGGSSLAPVPRLPGTPLVTAPNVNGSGIATPSLPRGPNTPVLSPKIGGDVTSSNTVMNSTNLSFTSPQNPSGGQCFPIPHNNSNKPSMSPLLPLTEYGSPAYLDARRLFVTCNAPFSMPYVQDITLSPSRVWSGVATAFSEDTAAPPRHTSTYAEYRDSRGSRTASLSRRWHTFVRATRQSIKGLVDRATGGTGDRIDRRLQQQRRWLSSTSAGTPDGNATTTGSFVNNDSTTNNNRPTDPSMAGLRDANYSHPAARLPPDISQLLQLIPVVLFTPLDYVAGRSIVRYLGRLSQHFIREDYDTDTGDDLNVFFQRAEMEIMCMVQAVVRLMGGNALLKHRIVYHEICDSDGSGSAFLFATVTGDVVQVSNTEFWGPHPRNGQGKKTKHHHNGNKMNNNRDGEDGDRDSEGGKSTTPRNRTRNDDTTENSDNNRSQSAAVSGMHSSRRRKSRPGASRHRSSRRHQSRAHRHRRRHRRSFSSSSSSSHGATSQRSSSGSSSSSAMSSHSVSSSTTANSNVPMPSHSSSATVQQK